MGVNYHLNFLLNSKADLIFMQLHSEENKVYPKQECITRGINLFGTTLDWFNCQIFYKMAKISYF